MRCLAFLALFLMPPMAAWSQEGGESLSFQPGVLSQTVEIQPNSKQGEVLWESGPSEPLQEHCMVVLFDGQASDDKPLFRLEASLDSAPGRWVSAEMETMPNGRFWGRFLLSAPSGARVIVRFVSAGRVRDAQSAHLFAVHALLPSSEPEGTGAQLPVVSAVPPGVLPREAWKAAGHVGTYVPMNPVRITVHHTDGTRTTRLQDSIYEMQLMQKYHMRGRGWNDIAYHFVIDGDGRVFQGRPESVVGAHVEDRNEGNVGIALMGKFTRKTGLKPTRKQMDSLLALTRWLVTTYSIDSGEIRGHKDYKKTLCPGESLYARLGELRRRAVPPESIALLVTPETRLRIASMLEVDGIGRTMLFDRGGSR